MISTLRYELFKTEVAPQIRPCLQLHRLPRKWELSQKTLFQKRTFPSLRLPLRQFGLANVGLKRQTPRLQVDGKVVYSFGAGLPTIVCAPLRVCMIELQPGEHIVGEPHIGDAVRWNISPGSFGSGDEVTSIIILKPQQPGLDTNLLVTTDRRAYYFRLISKVYLAYYHEDRTHIGLDKTTPSKRTIELRPTATSRIQSRPRIGGLHHRYYWTEAA